MVESQVVLSQLFGAIRHLHRSCGFNVNSACGVDVDSNFDSKHQLNRPAMARLGRESVKVLIKTSNL